MGVFGLEDMHGYARLDVGVCGQTPWLIAHLDNSEQHLDDPRLRRAWRGYLRAFQLLRYMPGAAFVAADTQAAWDLLRDLREPPPSVGWASDPEVLDEMGPAYIDLCVALADAGAPAPRVGDEIPDATGGPWAVGALLWEQERVAVTFRENTRYAAGRKHPDWDVWLVDETGAEQVLASLARGNA